MNAAHFFLEGFFLSLNKNFEMKKERSVLELVHWYVLDSIYLVFILYLWRVSEVPGWISARVDRVNLKKEMIKIWHRCDVRRKIRKRTLENGFLIGRYNRSYRYDSSKWIVIQTRENDNANLNRKNPLVTRWDRR